MAQQQGISGQEGGVLACQEEYGTAVGVGAWHSNLQGSLPSQGEQEGLLSKTTQ